MAPRAVRNVKVQIDRVDGSTHTLVVTRRALAGSLYVVTVGFLWLGSAAAYLYYRQGVLTARLESIPTAEAIRNRRILPHGDVDTASVDLPAINDSEDVKAVLAEPESVAAHQPAEKSGGTAPKPSPLAIEACSAVRIGDNVTVEMTIRNAKVDAGVRGSLAATIVLLDTASGAHVASASTQPTDADGAMSTSAIVKRGNRFQMRHAVHRNIVFRLPPDAKADAISGELVVALEGYAKPVRVAFGPVPMAVGVRTSSSDQPSPDAR